jgi:hypothetical protein
MNREQAVKYLSFSGFSDEQIKTIEGALNPNKWIPVSERLPEKGVDCLVFVKGYDGCAYYEDDMVLLPDNRLHESGYCKHGECEKCEHASDVIYTDFQVCSYWGEDETTNMYHNGWNVMNELEEVIAWMPLPEPYKAEGSGEE